MTTLSRHDAIVLAKEVLRGQARSYVSAAHALAQFLVDEEAEKRVLVGDEPTPPLPQRVRTMPLPFEDPSPPPDSDDLDDVAAAILRTDPLTTPQLVLVKPSVEEPDTGVREMLPKTDGGKRRASPFPREVEAIPSAGFCITHGYRNCSTCKEPA